jgi:hypothetical protein
VAGLGLTTTGPPMVRAWAYTHARTRVRIVEFSPELLTLPPPELFATFQDRIVAHLGVPLSAVHWECT